MEKQLKEMEADIERLTILSLGIGQMAKSTGENETFGKMTAVSRFLRTALNRLREPSAAAPT